MTRGKAGTRGRSILAGALLLCGLLSADGGPSWSDLSPDERTLLADMLKLDENTWPDAFAERMKFQSFFRFIHEAYLSTGESDDRDQSTSAFIHTELSRDVEARRRLGYPLGDNP